VKYSLKTKLSISYIFITLLCILLISLFANVLFEKQFAEYVKKNQEKKSMELVNLVSQQYKDNNKWDEENIKKIGESALESGLILRIKDLSGNIIWDAMVYHNGMCQRIIKHMAQNMRGRFLSEEGGYVEKTYPIFYDLDKVGTISIGYYGPYFFNDTDLAFINAFNRIMVIIGIMSLLIAVILGVTMAKRISKPISKVILTAKMISQRKYGKKVDAKSNTKEIAQLTETINNLAETLQKEEDLRKRLTADMAHEIRTPIATLQSHIEAMLDGIWELSIDRLKSCYEEIIRISKMVGDLEKLAKYESENLILEKSKFNISELIQNILINFEGEFKKKNIKVSFHGNDHFIVADKDKISQVIINLVSNALKYTPENKEVEISVEENNNMIQIRIKDTGIGISSEDLPHIFERFYRADKSRNRESGGSGIGLAITKAIVEAHKGKIDVKSELNIGSEFIVMLPK